METMRIDRMPLPRINRTDEGYLRGEAVVTRTGVFRYTNADGSVRRELRHPDDVFAADSLATLKMIPITVGHPTVLVNADNVKELGVGSTGDTVTPDADSGLISVPLTVTDKRGVVAVDGGQRELSLGYLVNVDEESGIYNGEAYTHRQRNPRYNHLAIVTVARAGKAARLNIDGVSVPTSFDEESNHMLKITLDGIAYDAAPEVVNALTKANASLAAMQVSLDSATTKHTADLSAVQAKLDAATADLKVAKDVADGEAARLDAAVTERLSLIASAADYVKADDMAGKSARQIKEAVIVAKYPDFKADGKDDVYIQARFDGILEARSDEKAKDVTGALRKDRSADPDSLSKVRTDAFSDLVNMHKTQKEG